MKNIKIEENAYKQIKQYCRHNGLTIYHWVTRVLLSKIEEERKNGRYNI